MGRKRIVGMILMCALVSGVQAGASDNAGLSFVGTTVDVTSAGDILSARDVELNVAGGVLYSEHVDFPVWAQTGRTDYSVVKLQGESMLLAPDGAEFRFSEAKLNRDNSQITLIKGGQVTHTPAGGLSKDDPDTYGCRGNKITINGLTQAFSLVCIGHVQISCSGGVLQVQVFTDACAID